MHTELNCSTGSKRQEEHLKQWILDRTRKETGKIKLKFDLLLKQVSVLRSLGLSNRSNRIVNRLASALKLFYGVNHIWVSQSEGAHDMTKCLRTYFGFKRSENPKRDDFLVHIEQISNIN